MGHYKTNDSSANQVTALPLSREDIIRYQSDLSNYIARFSMERQETAMLQNQLREEQRSFAEAVKAQDAKIAELTMLVVSLTNKIGV